MSTLQLLPSHVPGPFQQSLNKDTYPYRGFERPARTQPASSVASLGSNGHCLSRQSPPVSVLSISSGRLTHNNENIAPKKRDGLVDTLQPITTDTSSSAKSIPSAIKPSSPRTFFSPQHASTETPVRNTALTQDKNAMTEKDDILQAALEDLERYRNTRPKTQASSAITDAVPGDDGGQDAEPAVVDAPKFLPSMPLITSRVTEVSDISCTPFPILSNGPTTSSDLSSGPTQSLTILHSRQSDSSGFVHTVKTASLSNLSFSMLSKRLRPSQSSESRGFFSTHSRFSTDSDRPTTTSSIDENALWRSVKRRRIIEELIITEEGYISDLKALVYLISTLLASATSLPNRVRNLVQRNVLDILHLHELLLDGLHKMTYKAAARKWADTLAPAKVGSPRHIRWRSLDSQVNYMPPTNQRLSDIPLTSTTMSRTRAKMVGTEPGDVVEIVTLFRKAMVHFFAYEEYCANHEIIAHDLHRHLPTLWSAYGAGIESLARSLTAINKQADDGRKALTVGDLLIKPIQRVCKYPLLFDELLSYTPVSDDPTVHAELETLLQSLRDIVDAVNHATQNPGSRIQIHRRWSLRAHLTFERVTLSQDEFRMLGNALLCGVLHLTYQTRHGVTGAYALCVLYQQTLLIALPLATASKFDVVALIHLHDLKVDSASDGKGLQAPSAFHTWKMSFAVEGNLHEFLLSAASATEEEQWKKGLRGQLEDRPSSRMLTQQLVSCLALELRSIGTVYGRHGSLARRLSVQRAATLRSRASISQVILRNTHNPEELHEFRQPSTASINRSQSHMSSNRIVVLAPKRSDRARLESILGDVWTKDRLPYPGMIASRGGQIIRASAGSLARKLSLASFQGSFSRRSASLSISTKRSHETLYDSKRDRDHAPTFEIRRDSVDDRPTPRRKRQTSHDVPELDSMDTVVSRMIGDALPMTHKVAPTPKDDGIHRTGVLHKQPVQITSLPVGPDDSAQAFYPEEVDKMQKNVSVEEALAGKMKKRWSNPMVILKGRAAEGFRNMLYSTR